MAKIWSELPAARTREQVLDAATLIWIVFWGVVVWLVFQSLVGLAGVGRAVQAGGEGMIEGGRSLGDLLAGLPLIGGQVRDLTSDAFAAGGQPIAAMGTQLEQFITVVSLVLPLLLGIVTIGPWLVRYIPWRRNRLRQGRAALLAVRTSPDGDPATERILAMRAIARLDYTALLDFTPDPLGDWASGRHDRLARAELASVGLGPVAPAPPASPFA